MRTLRTTIYHNKINTQYLRFAREIARWKPGVSGPLNIMQQTGYIPKKLKID